MDVINAIRNLVIANGDEDQPNPMHRNVLLVVMKCVSNDTQTHTQTHILCMCHWYIMKYDSYMTENAENITISARTTHCVVPQ